MVEGGKWRMEDGRLRVEGGGWRWEKKKITVGYLMESMHSKSLQAFSKGLHYVQIHYTLGPWF